jgi:hypothetical protein
LKPYALIFFPYLILKKKWRAFLSGVTFLGAALLAPAMFYGFHGNYLVLKEWYLTLSRSTPGLLSTLDNVSLISCFTKWTGNLKISFVFSAVLTSLLVLLVLSLILKGKGLPRAAVLECAISFMIIPLVSPLGWDYTMLMSTLGIMLILQNYSAYSRLGRIMLIVNLGLITFTIYDLLGKNLYTLLMQASVTTVNFLILIGYLSYLRTKRIC